MAIKRYTCREHSGGIFSKEASRGRAPVRCRPAFPCDKADQPVKASADAVSRENTYSAAEKREATDEFDSMSNSELKAYAREHYSTIGRITSREQMIRALRAQEATQAELHRRTCQTAGCTTCFPAPVGAPEPVAKASAVANDSLPLAMRAKAQLEAVGWTVKGRAWIENASENSHAAQVTASRGAELLVITWFNGVLSSQEYSLEHLKPSDNGFPPSELHFNPDELTDSELVRMVKGMKVTWWNTLASSKEHATVVGNVTVEHIFFTNGDEDNSKRIVKFVDRDAGGFKAFNVAALLKVG